MERRFHDGERAIRGIADKIRTNVWRARQTDSNQVDVMGFLWDMHAKCQKRDPWSGRMGHALYLKLEQISSPLAGPNPIDMLQILLKRSLSYHFNQRPFNTPVCRADFTRKLTADFASAGEAIASQSAIYAVSEIYKSAMRQDVEMIHLDLLNQRVGIRPTPDQSSMYLHRF